ncbi:hypothetical protein MNVI_36850 [Mycobacterium noviomagense]|uniref:Uncharacterized protein n=1 Tax=Mycobacterium noviomagense TaxID=459858 RepID=A0A7I7PIA1_9MYCO|nr:hypothetical protein MNVI_36850 [Mycobacterium noviomagense]
MPEVGATIADPTVSGTSGRAPINAAWRSPRCRQPRTISEITNAITSASTAAKMSDPINVVEFKPGSFRRER